MGAVRYISMRSTVHADGAVVALEVDLQDAVRFREVRKDVHRASNGDPETLYHGADTRWELEFEPAAGDAYALLQEFLRSTSSGEVFDVWIYGTEAKPISVRRMDSGYTPTLLIPTGVKRIEPYVCRITVIEA